MEHMAGGTFPVPPALSEEDEATGLLLDPLYKHHIHYLLEGQKMAIKRVIGSFATAVKEATDNDSEEILAIEFGPDKDEFYVSNPGWISFGEFAHASNSGLDTNSAEGQAAMYDLLRGSISAPPKEVLDELSEGAPVPTRISEWNRFKDVAVVNGVESEELMAIVHAIVQEFNARPTRLPSGSTDGQRNSSMNSNSKSSKPSKDIPEDDSSREEAPDDLQDKQPAAATAKTTRRRTG